MRGWAAAAVALWAGLCHAGYRVEAVSAVSGGGVEGRGHVYDPQFSPDGTKFSFELLGDGGDTLEVHLADVVPTEGKGVGIADAAPVLSSRDADPFQLQGPGGQPVSEHLTWGPPKRGRARFAVAATRLAVRRGAASVNFDIYLVEPGRRRFLSDHPENDAQPAFSPDGEFLAFSSGRTGQGDIYLYHFFAEADPTIRLTFEPVGSEMYPAWDPKSRGLVFVGHLGSEDHLYRIEDARSAAAERDPERRKTALRRQTRDLTPGWKDSCLAPSFSPDGRWIAFYSRDAGGGSADLYVLPAGGGAPRRVLEAGLPETHGGPRWSPAGDGLFAVREDADRMNPLVWVPLAEGAPVEELATGTELNADPFVRLDGSDLLLVFTAQGGAERSEKRWRQVYQARLSSPGGTP